MNEFSPYLGMAPYERAGEPRATAARSGPDRSADGVVGTQIAEHRTGMDRAPDLRFAGTAPGARRVPRRRTVVSPRSHYGQSTNAAAGFGISGGWHLPIQPQPCT